MRRISALTALLLAGCATGSAVERPPTTYQQSGLGLVRTVDDIEAACGKRTLGCYRANTMILPNPCLAKGWYADTFCHEQAHKNGWRHPQ
jgi:hypothetical protein